MAKSQTALNRKEDHELLDCLKANYGQFISLLLFTAGCSFAVGVYKSTSDCKLEKLTLKQEYAEKLNEVISECKETQISNIGRDVNELRQAVESLKSSK